MLISIISLSVYAGLTYLTYKICSQSNPNSNHYTWISNDEAGVIILSVFSPLTIWLIIPIWLVKK